MTWPGVEGVGGAPLSLLQPPSPGVFAVGRVAGRRGAEGDFQGEDTDEKRKAKPWEGENGGDSESGDRDAATSANHTREKDINSSH